MGTEITTTTSIKKALESKDFPRDFQQIVGERIVRTHDSKGIELSVGNRAMRRQFHSLVTGGSGDRKHPKQYHKQGH